MGGEVRESGGTYGRKMSSAAERRALKSAAAAFDQGFKLVGSIHRQSDKPIVRRQRRQRETTERPGGEMAKVEGQQGGSTRCIGGRDDVMVCGIRKRCTDRQATGAANAQGIGTGDAQEVKRSLKGRFGEVGPGAAQSLTHLGEDSDGPTAGTKTRQTRLNQ